jgi:SAM-dependent methyltransferase
MSGSGGARSSRAGPGPRGSTPGARREPQHQVTGMPGKPTRDGDQAPAQGGGQQDGAQPARCADKDLGGSLPPPVTECRIRQDDMPLVEVEAFRDLLTCPRCGGELTGALANLTCTRESCSRSYWAVGNPPKPVLVDPESSVLDIDSALASGGSSPVARGYGGRIVSLIVRRLVQPRNRVAERIVVRLAADLLAETKGRSRPLVLVVGGGTIGSGVESLYADPRLDLLAFDVYASDNVQFLADGHQVPLKDGSVDGVLIQAVLEHVLEPQKVVAEIHRVLRTGGLVYANTPFMQHVHEGAYDFTRFTASGHRYLFRNFAVRDSGASSGLGTQLLWSIMYFARGIHYRVGQLAHLLFLWLPKLDGLLDPRVTIDGACGVFFYGHADTDAIGPKEVISYYSGAQR